MCAFLPSAPLYPPTRTTVVGFPRFKEHCNIDIDAFYKTLFEEHGTVVGPGHWFEESRRSFRLGYGWPTLQELQKGLQAIDATIASVLELK